MAGLLKLPVAAAGAVAVGEGAAVLWVAPEWECKVVACGTPAVGWSVAAGAAAALRTLAAWAALVPRVAASRMQSLRGKGILRGDDSFMEVLKV